MTLWSSLRDHVMQSVAAAALLGGGSLLVGGAVQNAEQDTRIERLERLDDKIDDISKNVAETRESVVRLEAKMENSGE